MHRPRAQNEYSNAKAEGRFSEEAFVYHPHEDAYRCPAGELLTRRYDTKEGDLTMGVGG